MKRFNGFVALDSISGLGSFLGIQEYSYLRKKIQSVGSRKIINSKVYLLSDWMAVPTSLGAPVPKTVFIVSIQRWARALKWRIHPLKLCVHCCKNKKSSNRIMQRSISW